MNFVKLKYTDDVNSLMIEHTSKRIEFFFHYWELLFNQRTVLFDEYYLKSHRTILDKVKLQLEGNFEKSKKYIEFFMLNDSTFHKNNCIIKMLGNSREKRSLRNLKKICSISNSRWKVLESKKPLKQVNNLLQWIDTHYAQLIINSLNSILDKNVPLTSDDKIAIKQLTNYFIIELFNKGYNESYIQNIPDALFDYKRFPYEKISSDFTDEKLYENYKEIEWGKMTLEKQLNGLLNLLARPSRKRYLIYRVYDVNFRHNPIKILDVEFYNPNEGFAPKINHKSPVKLFEETFTLKPERYELSSQCNACVLVNGIQEEQMYLLPMIPFLIFGVQLLHLIEILKRSIM